MNNRSAVSVPTERVTFQTSDGVSLVASFVPAKTLRAPGVLLLHMLGQDLTSYDPVLQAFRDAGYATLAVDFRGHGRSTRGELDWEHFSAEQWLGVVEDARAGLEALRRRRGVDGQRVAVVGASIGANAGFQAAAADPGVAAVVLLSPGLDYRGVMLMPSVAGWGSRPAFVAAAKDDSYAAESSRQLAAALPRAELATLTGDAGDAHGTNMFAADPTLLERVLVFLTQHVH